MHVVSTRDLRNAPGKVRAALAQGDVVVTNRGKPYAVMMPVADPDLINEVLALAARIRAQMAVSSMRQTAAAEPNKITADDIDEEVRQSRLDRDLRLIRVYDRALELCEGKSDAAVEWLKSPNPLFEGKTPLAQAQTESGAQFVLQVLGRLEHGIFS